MIEWDLFPHCKDGLTYNNQPMWYTTLTERTQKHDHQLMQETHLTKFNTISWSKKPNLNKLRKGNGLNIIKPIYEKHTVKLILSCETESFSSRWGTKQDHLLLLLQFNIVLEVPVRAIRQENKIKAFKLKRKK